MAIRAQRVFVAHELHNHYLSSCSCHHAQHFRLRVRKVQCLMIPGLRGSMHAPAAEYRRAQQREALSLCSSIISTSLLPYLLLAPGMRVI
ncbi:hypothetical protein K431DRAFT_281590 [Polychaeton citri CBS 116435]|uniref:Uncharacterized protein n=1 Tax=Polychaeton citri CBS 116435 TaxID=1314669 RepID=A0A9P4QGU2_9PEZI|nr:hypothetical protein K431DRAFT_281590 [Polychaeton citri CBS 116435]